MAVKNKRFLRIFDVNLNRCREGLRVIEDSARFIFDKPSIYKKTRALRHALDLATREIYPELVSGRDSQKDAGRVIKEGGRESVASVLSANFRRVQESLRVLEEYSRLISPGMGRAVKKARFSAYSLEKKFLEEI
ncbi:MAG TPA: thiamine-phosphate pyrophosphorylase [Elusimicrobia bacterium]|nr:MAG: hypothetical protein A2278_06160 [Elusimicrobia bacterium RIFOXYA12_FULL_49_49]OGS10940.1 MAG: hypothetical protein A2386_08310 [Elusimicrobia bacterium RIFOXYB1_FULL_48_9]OGS16625.1 MAG: hypothetical protein A2251_04575 [Elusimicrobia bacterium RIFOXYA2_FULL_47_53]OGS25474.1 MAG: hypothetical protein A2339_00150 [Elusimicrobia bacterium RIFOXYB12_FULL_50_12]OGS31603.1 MAG: hypothetical protein A2323_03295 [Elusimicrobia bacterium RIFOXYB2_FULL_46_23]HBU69050.1 thiamine-phosphate pyrop